MEESHRQATTSSRLGIRNTGGEIVEVQGGHIVRSTGRKDRHSKVCTAKGTRDRRVRLSAHTAIQFYDVQDRLGYDRPSKAVDWLIKKAKAAIDELAELPAWNPNTAIASTTATTTPITRTRTQQKDHHMSNDKRYQFPIENFTTTSTNVRSDSQNHIHHQQMGENPNSSSSFLPPSLDSDTIADTIKSFFPMGASAETSTSSLNQFQNYPPDLVSRTSSQNQDLRLSLQSFQEQPILLQQHAQAAQNEQQAALLSAAAANSHHLGFDSTSAGNGGGWSEHQQQPAEFSRFQRMVSWNAGGAADTGGGGGGGFMFNAPPLPLLHPLFGQNQFFSQRGPLQSSNPPSVRAWIDLPMTNDQHLQRIHYQQQQISGTGIAASDGGRFSGFRIPARIQGEEEEQNGIHNKPSSASSDTCH